MTNSKNQTTSLDNYKPMLSERGDLAVKKKQIEARIKELDEELRPVLEGRGEMVYAGYQFNVKMQGGRKTFKRAEAEEFIRDHGGDVDDFVKVGAPFTTFTVKAVEEL